MGAPSDRRGVSDPSGRPAAEGLQTFDLDDLAPFTREGIFAPESSQDFRLFYAGRDDLHGILKYLWARVTVSAYLNMYGFDDQELNDLVMKVAADPHAVLVATLDKSQAGGAHERTILASDMAADPIGFAAHFAIGQSATHQISHTKGGVLDGRVGFEGSTNWSAAGEGTFTPGSTGPGGPGFKAQNNTLAVFTDPSACSRFTAELLAEHLAAASQGGRLTVVRPDSETAT